MKMPTIEVQVHRVSTVSQRPFEDVVSRLQASAVRTCPSSISRSPRLRLLAIWRRWLQTAVGFSNFMEFARFDSGDVLRKETGGKGPKLRRPVGGKALSL